MIKPKFNAKGEPVYRAVSDDAELNGQKLADWYFAHQKGREHARTTFGEMHFHWNGPASKKPADYPSCSAPGGIWSVEAAQAMREFFFESGDLHPIIFEGDPDKYVLFDCWTEVEVTSNDDFFFLEPGTLKYLNVSKDAAIPELFYASSLDLMCGERFKSEWEARGFTGIDFFAAEVRNNP